MRRGKSTEHINSDNIKDHEEEEAEIWTFSGSDDMSADNQDPKGRKILFFLPFLTKWFF